LAAGPRQRLVWHLHQRSGRAFCYGGAPMTMPVLKEQTVTYIAPTPQHNVAPQSEKKRLFGRIDWPSLQKETKTPEVITTSAEVPAAPAWNPPVPAAAPFSTATSTNAYHPPAVQYYRPQQEPSNRGVVMIDVNGVR